MHFLYRYVVFVCLFVWMVLVHYEEEVKTCVSLLYWAKVVYTLEYKYICCVLTTNVKYENILIFSLT